MRNSKKTIKVLICAVIFFCVVFALDLILYPCTFMRNDIHTVTSEQHDVIFMGTSDSKMNIDPDYVLEGTNLTGHNLSVGGEYPVDSYYMLKLLIEKGTAPSTLVYEIDPSYFMTEKTKGNNYLLFYHEFPISMAKVQYFAATLLDSDFRAWLFPFYEYPLRSTLPRISSNLSQKLTGNYDVSYLKGSVQEYHENGYIEKYPVAVENFPAYTPTYFDTDTLNPDNMEYLRKLISLCRENDITFVAISTPQADAILQQYSESYNAAWEYFETFCERNNVKYYNFNTDYYGAYPHALEEYVDYNGHMNGENARAFSKVLGEVLEEI